MLTLNKGINFGGWFSQCEIDENHYATRFGKDDVAWVKDHGFDHIRLPVDCDFVVAGDRTEAHFQLLDNFFGWCQEMGLNVILDLHKAPGYDFNDAGGSEDDWLPLFKEKSVQKQFIEIWQTLARRYGTRKNIAFELLNEVVDEKYIRPWNKLIKKTVKAIRKIAPDVTIIYGGALWNSALTVSKLQKPRFKNVIITFHYYEPLLFTHQKAYWVKTMDPNQTVDYPNTAEWFKSESKKLGLQGMPIQFYKGENMDMEFHAEFLQDAIRTAKKYKVPLYCGEFGVIDRAPEDATARWFGDVIQVFKDNGIGYSLWSYKGMDFGICDDHYKAAMNVVIEK